MTENGDQGGDERVRFYRRLYDPIARNSRHGLAVVDTAACEIVYFNARFLASHELPPGQPAPIACQRVLCTARECTASCPARVAIDLRGEQRRAPVVPADGLRARAVQLISIPLEDPSGQIGTHALVIEKEETPAQDDLEDEREHLAAITRYSADAIVGLDLQDHVQSWNQGAVDTFGYSAKETIGREFRFLLPDDVLSKREYEALLKEFDRRGLVKNQQLRLRSREGRTVVCSITRSWLRDAAGNPRGSSVICRDVTMEVLLKELIEHQLRAMSVTHEIGDLLHSTRSVDEILQLILIGVTAGQGLGFNRAFLLLVEDDAAGRSYLRGRLAIGPPDATEANRIWRTLSHEALSLTDLHQRYRSECAGADEAVNSIARSIDIPLDDRSHLLTRVIQSGRAVNVLEGRVAGEEVSVDPRLIALLQTESFAVVPLNTRERALGALLVDNRITGIPVSDADLQMLKVFANHAGIALENSQLRANLEHRLQELEQLTRTMREGQERLMRAERLSVIGELAARVVHEVRNPLVAIGGFARLVRRGIDAQDPRSDYLRIISDEVARLERIVSELLDFSRPQSRLHLKQVDLNALVHEVVSMATVEARDHGVSVVERYDPALGQVTIDSDKTRQVLLNLLKNAVDVLVEKGGEIQVETRGGVDGEPAGVDAHAELERSRFRVTIRDDGPGIPAERRDQVFQPGFTTRPDGTGFGLAIAKRLVELQGGQIGLRPDVAVGCAFDVVLPRLVEERINER